MGKIKGMLLHGVQRAISPTRTCAAIRYSDQMVCAKCDLAWDVNDPEPPACKGKA